MSDQRALDLFGHVAQLDTGARSAFDFYETPAYMTKALVHFHRPIANSSVLLPCAGNNAIGEVLARDFGCSVFTNDVDPAQPATTHFDAASDRYWDEHAPKATWVIDNLPFDVAFDIVPKAVNWMARRHVAGERVGGCAFLLRKTFLEPTLDRGPFLATLPPQRQICLPRHSFRGDGSDSVSCDWFIWKANVTSQELITPPIVVVPKGWS